MDARIPARGAVFGRAAARAGLIAALLAGAGCNRYAFFDVAGYEQASFNDQADILFVIDNSPSMAEETAALALNFNAFIESLTTRSDASTDGLPDAVSNYVTYVQDRGHFLDYHLAVTTTSAEWENAGPTDGLDPGEAGTLVGEPIAKGDGNVADAFLEQALCEAANWETYDVPSDPSYECGDDPGDTVSQEYLDCICGFGEWENNSGSGNEEPLEAALMTLCRSVEDPPDACYDPLSPFVIDDEIPTNPDTFLRDDSTVVVVVVSDEGDSSRRMAQGETDPTEAYLDPIQEFGHNFRYVEIGPNWDPDTGNITCPSTSIPTWSVERVYNMAQATKGFYNPIVEDQGGECILTDFAQHLRDLGDLLKNLLTSFQLQSVPDVATIRVWIDDVEVPRAALVEGEAGMPDAVYDEGWSYDPADNAVAFWGSWVPDYNQDVRIYYRPLEGKPREVPF